MNGFFKWFKSGAKIKRWIFLMLIGIVLVCYGIAKVLVTDEMGFRELAKIIFVFVLGFTFTIISIIFYTCDEVSIFFTYFRTKISVSIFI